MNIVQKSGSNTVLLNKNLKINSRRGFTLAEILISLLILGVIASLTIPSLIQNTQAKEEQVKVKKALSMFNQALSLNYTLNGKTIQDYNADEYEPLGPSFLLQDLKKRFSVVYESDQGMEIFFKTQDGLAYSYDGGSLYVYTGTKDTLPHSIIEGDLTMNNKWYGPFNCVNSNNICVPECVMTEFLNASNPSGVIKKYPEALNSLATDRACSN